MGILVYPFNQDHLYKQPWKMAHRLVLCNSEYEKELSCFQQTNNLRFYQNIEKNENQMSKIRNKRHIHKKNHTKRRT